MFGKKFFSTAALGGVTLSLVECMGGSTASAESTKTKEEVLEYFCKMVDLSSKMLKLDEDSDEAFKLKEYFENLRNDLSNDNYRYMRDSHSPDAVEKEEDFIYLLGMGPFAMILGKCDFCCGQACEERKVLETIRKREDGGFDRFYIWFD